MFGGGKKAEGARVTGGLKMGTAVELRLPYPRANLKDNFAVMSKMHAVLFNEYLCENVEQSKPVTLTAGCLSTRLNSRFPGCVLFVFLLLKQHDTGPSSSSYYNCVSLQPDCTGVNYA